MDRRLFLKTAGVSAILSLPKIDLASAMSPAVGNSDVNSAFATASQYLSTRSSMSIDVRRLAYDYIDKSSPGLVRDLGNRESDIQNIGTTEKWDGIFSNISSQSEIVYSDIRGNNITLGLKDYVSLNWTPNLKALSDIQIAEIGNNPELKAKYGLDETPKPLNSMVSSNHTMTLNKWSRGWQIISDEYFEPGIAGRSMKYSADSKFDQIGHSYAARSLQIQPQSSPQRQNNLLGRTFDYMAAVNYANMWALSFNTPTYSNLTPNDCANFVSQCFVAGGYPTDSSWFKNSSSWVNNWQLRNWLISSGRGVNDTSQSQLGYGDIVNFKGASTLTWDHVAIVTRPYALGCLISCHSNPSKNVPLSAYGSDPSWAGMSYASTYLYY